MIKQYLSLVSGTFVFSLPVITIIFILTYVLPVPIIDTVYNASLFVPRKLGFVAEVTPDDSIEIWGSGKEDVLLEKGRYRIYSERSLASIAEINLVSHDTGDVIEAISLYNINSNQAIVVGEPQFIFNLDTTGQYSVVGRTSNGGGITDEVSYTIVPYIGNQNATLALIGGIVQIGFIAFCARLLYRFLKREQIQELKASQERKRDQWEEFLDDKSRE